MNIVELASATVVFWGVLEIFLLLFGVTHNPVKVGFYVFFAIAITVGLAPIWSKLIGHFRRH